MAAQNRTLGKFHLTGLPPAPRGMPQIEVTFDIDANGILNVTAKDNATGKDQKITITSSSGLSKEEVDRMAKEADAHSAEDKAKREEIEAKNQLDSMVYQMEKMLRESGDKISGTERGEVENAIADAKKALESGDKASMDGTRTPDPGFAQAGRTDVQGGRYAGRAGSRSNCRHAAGRRRQRSGQERRRRDRRGVRGRRGQEVIASRRRQPLQHPERREGSALASRDRLEGRSGAPCCIEGMGEGNCNSKLRIRLTF